MHKTIALHEAIDSASRLLVNTHNFGPDSILGREPELRQVCQILSSDGDLLLAGVPGIGRKTLIQAAATVCHAKVVEIDCLRATSYKRFLMLIAEAFTTTFSSAIEQRYLGRWSQQQQFHFSTAPMPQLHWDNPDNWDVFQRLLLLPQMMAEVLTYRVVLVFQNFPHLRSWDKQKRWEQYLKQQIQAQPQVSYALIATVAESWGEQDELQVLSLKPIANTIIEDWITKLLRAAKLRLAADAASLFASYVQGHFGDAIALARRLELEYRQDNRNGLIQARDVHHSTDALVQDLAVTFESLILLLPPTQVRVLESLALDPTDRPHAREYIQKHDLSRGGTLQGALASLVQKGLIYDADQNYRVALPLLAFWLKHRLR